MRLEIDAEARALYLRIRDGAVRETRELQHGIVVDLDQAGNILGVELLNIEGLNDEAGYAHVDVAITTSPARALEIDQATLRKATKPSAGR